MNKNALYTGIAVVIAVAVVGYFFFMNSTNLNNNQPQNNQQPASSTPNPFAQTSPAQSNSVIIQDVTQGTGTVATPGNDVTVTYVGKLQNGQIFDQSSNHGDGTFTFTLGAGQVIPGWEQGIQGMKVGGERILQIPPQLGYGSQQVGPIPANSTLIFDVKLLKVSSSTPTAPEGPAAQ